MKTFSNSTQSSTEFEQAIQVKFQEMIQAMGNSDHQLVATYFTEDALLKFPGIEAVKGRKAIAELHEKMIQEGISVKPTTTEVEDFGKTGYEIGAFELSNKERQVVDKGTYATIWKKVDDEWKLHRDVVSSSTSPRKE